MMAEVSKYSTYTQQMTAYASIDKNSASRNEKVQIDTDNTFVTDTFENDTTIAPTFKLSKGTQTELSGIVYEDSPKESTPIKISGNNIYERVGDGIYNNENVMANVLVELLSVSMENGQYDSDTARTGENERHESRIGFRFVRRADKWVGRSVLPREFGCGVDGGRVVEHGFFRAAL